MKIFLTHDNLFFSTEPIKLKNYLKTHMALDSFLAF